MRFDNKANRRMASVAVLSAVLFGVSIDASFAKKAPKEYPEQGRVTGRDTVGTASSHREMVPAYKVVTDTRVYEMVCRKWGDFECGGDKKIQIGDVIHFRVEKGWAYIPTTKNGADAGEQRLQILSEDLKPDAKSADNAPAAKP